MIKEAGFDIVPLIWWRYWILVSQVMWRTGSSLQCTAPERSRAYSVRENWTPIWNMKAARVDQVSPMLNVEVSWSIDIRAYRLCLRRLSRVRAPHSKHLRRFRMFLFTKVRDFSDWDRSRRTSMRHEARFITQSTGLENMPAPTIFAIKQAHDFGRHISVIVLTSCQSNCKINVY